MDMLVLKQNDGQPIILELFNKFIEETEEVKNAYYHESIERFPEELFDVIQVSTGILYQLEKIGFDIPRMLERHNKKLLERGWEYEKVIHITVEGGTDAEKGRR